MFYFIILLFVNVIFITITDLPVRVSTCVGHLRVIVSRNEGFGCLYVLIGNCWLCDVCIGLPCLFNGCFFSFHFLGLCNYCL